MTTFFNRKEEVIDLKLTRYGRTLLSLGKLKPEYYCFYDNDLIYDNQYGGQLPVTGSMQKLEEQNIIADRIKEKTSITNIKLIELSKTNYRVLLGPFNDINSLKDSFEKMNSLNFENLEILKNV